MDEKQKPPLMYYSRVDFGMIMRLPVPKPLNYFAIVGEAYPAPNLSEPDIYEYRKVEYIPEYHWYHTEPYADFIERIKKEMGEDEPQSPYHYTKNEILMRQVRYPEMAMQIVEILPCWVYRLKE